MEVATGVGSEFERLTVPILSLVPLVRVGGLFLDQDSARIHQPSSIQGTAFVA